ncbi:MAG: CotH kinase family protein, partial [Verrucomicrobiota bacterium]
HNASFVRDELVRRNELDMGLLSPRGKYVSLYINGYYWGVYNLHERPSQEFFSDHLGGEDADWDVIHHPDTMTENFTVLEGDGEAWGRFQTLVEEGVNSDGEYESLSEYLDMDIYIDSLISRMWTGDYDWCGPVSRNGEDVTVFRNKNWYVGRRSRGGLPGPFRFFSWDAEMSMGLNLMTNLDFANHPQDVLNFDLTAANDPGSPTAAYARLRFFPRFRRDFSDRVSRHFFNGGALDPRTIVERVEELESILHRPLVGESARWGDMAVDGTLFTRNDHWLDEINWLKGTFVPQRHLIFLEQLKSQSLFSAVSPPRLSEFSGHLASGVPIEMAAPSGTIYYTTDGSDPAVFPPSLSTTFIDEGVTCRYLVPTRENGGSTLGDNWKGVNNPPFYDQWKAGPTGLGYERSSFDFFPLIQTDIQDDLDGLQTTVYVRIEFEIADEDFLRSLQGLVLRMKYDDGYVAFLNGEEIHRENAPGVVRWNSAAIDPHLDVEAVAYEDVDVSSHLPRLVVGKNVLAVQGLNVSSLSSDFLLLPRLDAVFSEAPPEPSATARVYEGPVLLSGSATIKARVRDEAGRWSSLAEGAYTVGSWPSSENLAVTEIHFRPLGPRTPEESAVALTRTDFEFIELTNTGSEPLNLAGSRFIEGIQFTFGEFQLGVGESVLLVRNAAAMVSRYGEAVADHIGGEYTSKLSNNGEVLTFVDAAGEIVFRFAYTPEAPWLEEAAGDGVSIQWAGSLASGAAYGNLEQWNVSAEIGGSPGKAGSGDYALWATQFFDPGSMDADPEADPDGDGLTNLVEYAFASDPREVSFAETLTEITLIDEGDGEMRPVFQYQRRPNTADLEFQ